MYDFARQIQEDMRRMQEQMRQQQEEERRRQQEQIRRQQEWNTLYGCHHLLGPAYPPKFLVH